MADASSAAQAGSYYSGYGLTFGFSTHDGDNSEGAGAITGSGIYGGVPWTGVIRTSDMQLVYDESDTSFLDIESIAVELSTP